MGDQNNPKTIMDIVDISTLTFKSDTNSIANASELIKYAGDESDDLYGYIRFRYKTNIYKIPYDKETFITKEPILECKLEGNIGKYVEYKGNKWIVFRENEKGVELITANTIGTEVTIGGYDFEETRKSYNNAITTLVNECKIATGLEVGGDILEIRSIGGPAIDETYNTDTIKFDDFKNIFTPNNGITFENYEGLAEEKGIKIGDLKHVDDVEEMKKIGILCSDNMEDYWLASRCVEEKSSEIWFCIRTVLCMIHKDSRLRIVDVYNSGRSYYHQCSEEIRPVITLKAGILNGAKETGTIDDPIILN